MIAAVEQRADTRQAPEPAANPLRCGEMVMCPVCERSGETWRWALRRTPRYEAWTVPVYRCGVCRNVFAVKEPGT